jgi:hypothetical protein
MAFYLEYWIESAPGQVMRPVLWRNSFATHSVKAVYQLQR